MGGVKTTRPTAITVFIGKVLVTKPNNTPGPRTRGGSDAGKSLGQKVDNAFQKYVRNQFRMSSVSTAAHANYMYRLVCALKARRGFKITRFNIMADKLQHAVGDTELKLSAKLDFVVKVTERHHHIVELKTTQLSPEDHERVYRVRCKNQPLLVNGLPNNGYTKHQLQLGFCMMCYTKKNPDIKVTGSVIVVCRESKTYGNHSVIEYKQTNDVFVRKQTYNYDHSRVNIGVQNSARGQNSTLEWPVENSTQHMMIKKSLHINSSTGGRYITATKYSDANYMILEAGPNIHVTAIIVSKEKPDYTRSARRAGHLEIVRSISSQHTKRTGTPTHAYILSMKNGKFRKEKVATKPVL
jgi:hypothetical protein